MDENKKVLIETENVTCSYEETPTGTWISNLKVKEGQTGKGIGTKFMKELLPKLRKPVCLTILYPRPLNFYLRLGFEIDFVTAIDPETNQICDADLSYNL